MQSSKDDIFVFKTKQNDVLIMGYPQNPFLEGSSTGIVL